MMKKRLLCLLLVFLCLLAGCRKSSPNLIDTDPPAESVFSNQSQKDSPKTVTKTPYQRKYTYPENTTFFLAKTQNTADGLDLKQDRNVISTVTPLWDSYRSKFLSTAPHDYSVTYGNNQILSGVYKQSEIRHGDTFISHEYKLPNGGFLFINAETGEMTGAIFRLPSSASATEKTVTEETSIQIATNFIKDRIPVEEYQITCTWVEVGEQYMVEFRKYINEIATVDHARVYVQKDGEVGSFTSSMLGKIPTNTVLNINTEQSDAAVLAATEELYCRSLKSNQEVLNLSIDSRFLYLTEDGTPALIYNVDVQRIEVNKDIYMTSGARAEIIILPSDPSAEKIVFPESVSS